MLAESQKPLAATVASYCGRAKAILRRPHHVLGNDVQASSNRHHSASFTVLDPDLLVGHGFIKLD